SVITFLQPSGLTKTVYCEGLEKTVDERYVYWFADDDPEDGEGWYFKADKDGEYDLDGIKKAATDFVEKYNKMVDEAGKSNSNETLRNGVWMVNNTKKNEALLSKAGITIGKDNKLSFDSSRVTKGNVSHLKSVFSGRSSFAGRVSSKASNFESIAKRGLSNHTYNRTGNYQIAKDVATRLNRKA
ncbi:MAG: hypothetical protein J5622_00415, partial [Firmicutes bacterium]|nr:hypothetical protein [Bacillota bacterium]